MTRHTRNAFYEASLHEELQKMTVTGIVLAGVSTSIGIERTARAANERGYTVTFAKDAMTDMFADAHENSLKYIFPTIGEIGDTDQVIEKVS
ncbi:MAG: isochorismatase family protein [Ginsengibacter sp.]